MHVECPLRLVFLLMGQGPEQCLRRDAANTDFSKSEAKKALQTVTQVHAKFGLIGTG